MHSTAGDAVGVGGIFGSFGPSRSSLISILTRVERPIAGDLRESEFHGVVLSAADLHGSRGSFRRKDSNQAAAWLS